MSFYYVGFSAFFELRANNSSRNKCGCRIYQWSFRKTVTMGTLASQAEIGVWVQALWRFRWSWGIAPENPPIYAFLTFLNTLTMGTAFTRVPHRNNPWTVWSDTHEDMSYQFGQLRRSRGVYDVRWQLHSWDTHEQHLCKHLHRTEWRQSSIVCNTVQQLINLSYNQLMVPPSLTSLTYTSGSA